MKLIINLFLIINLIFINLTSLTLTKNQNINNNSTLSNPIHSNLKNNSTFTTKIKNLIKIDCSNDGTILYALDINHSLYSDNNNIITKLTNSIAVKDFKICNDNSVIILDTLGELYLIKNKITINIELSNIINFKLDKNSNIIYALDNNYNLYKINNNKINKISSNIYSYYVCTNNLFFLNDIFNDTHNLYRLNKNNTLCLIKSNIINFYSSFNSSFNYFLDNDYRLYSLSNNSSISSITLNNFSNIIFTQNGSAIGLDNLNNVFNLNKNSASLIINIPNLKKIYLSSKNTNFYYLDSNNNTYYYNNEISNLVNNDYNYNNFMIKSLHFTNNFDLVYSLSFDGTLYKINNNSYLKLSEFTNVKNILFSKDSSKLYIYANNENLSFFNISISNILELPSAFTFFNNIFYYRNDTVFTLLSDLVKNVKLNDVKLLPPYTIHLISSPTGLSNYKLSFNLNHNLSNYENIFFGFNPTYNAIILNLSISSKFNNNYINYKINPNDKMIDLGKGEYGLTQGKEIKYIFPNDTYHTNCLVGINPLNLNNLDLNNSYYVKGNYKKNDFISSNNNKYLINSRTITENGIYQLHYIDYIGNTYDEFLEIGRNNENIIIQIDDSKILALEKKYKINTEFTHITEKQKNALNNWLLLYSNDFSNNFKNRYTQLIKDKYFGFDLDTYYKIDLNIFLDNITKYLNPITLNDSSFNLESVITNKYSINNILIYSDINKFINREINSIIDSNLNYIKVIADSENVTVDKNIFISQNILISYIEYVQKYNKWLNQEFQSLIQSKISLVSLGYLTAEQIKEIMIKINSSKILFLKPINWVNNFNQNNFLTNIDINKLDIFLSNLIHDFINDPNALLQQEIKNIENAVNYNNKYCIDNILKTNHLKRPQNKFEILNFNNTGYSYKMWLSIQINILHNKKIKKIILIFIFILILLSLIIFILVYRYRVEIKNYICRIKRNKK